MRMRQSIAEIEDAFFEEIEDDRERRERLRKRAERRQPSVRPSARTATGRCASSLLVLVLLGTAVVVTWRDVRRRCTTC